MNSEAAAAAQGQLQSEITVENILNADVVSDAGSEEEQRRLKAEALKIANATMDPNPHEIVIPTTLIMATNENNESSGTEKIDTSSAPNTMDKESSIMTTETSNSKTDSQLELQRIKVLEFEKERLLAIEKAKADLLLQKKLSEKRALKKIEMAKLKLEEDEKARVAEKKKREQEDKEKREAQLAKQAEALAKFEEKMKGRSNSTSNQQLFMENLTRERTIKGQNGERPAGRMVTEKRNALVRLETEKSAGAPQRLGTVKINANNAGNRMVPEKSTSVHKLAAENSMSSKKSISRPPSPPMKLDEFLKKKPLSVQSKEPIKLTQDINSKEAATVEDKSPIIVKEIEASEVKVAEQISITPLSPAKLTVVEADLKSSSKLPTKGFEPVKDAPWKATEKMGITPSPTSKTIVQETQSKYLKTPSKPPTNVVNEVKPVKVLNEVKVAEKISVVPIATSKTIGVTTQSKELTTPAPEIVVLPELSKVETATIAIEHKEPEKTEVIKNGDESLHEMIHLKGKELDNQPVIQVERKKSEYSTESTHAQNLEDPPTLLIQNIEKKNSVVEQTKIESSKTKVSIEKSLEDELRKSVPNQKDIIVMLFN